MMPRTHTVFVLVFTVFSFHTTSNKPKTKFCLGLKLELLYFRKKTCSSFIFETESVGAGDRRHFNFQNQNISSVKLKKNDLVDIKSLRIYWGMGQNEMLRPLYSHLLGKITCDTIWPFHGFLALGLEKFTA